mgnify:CR=1 FL=1
MPKFAENIAPFVLEQIETARLAAADNDQERAFRHLENAHVLGQESTYWHVKVHWLMLLWAFRNRDTTEAFGQLIRILGASLLTAIKGVPIGNTGGSNVSPVKPMRLTEEHAAVIAKAKNSR